MKESATPVMSSATCAQRAEVQTTKVDPRRALFDEEVAFVWRTLRHLKVPERELPDVSQEVFLTVFRRLDDFDPARSARRTWIYGIARNVARNHGRLARFRRESLTDAAPEPLDVAPRADEALDARRARALVAGAVATLDDAQRDVFILHELEGVPMKDVVAEADVPLATGYSRLRLARQKVERWIREMVRPGGLDD